MLSLHLLLTDETPDSSARSGSRSWARRDPGEHRARRAGGRGGDDRRVAGGRLGHAALDVFDIEPLPAGHPLTRLDNVTLSAHSAFRTPEASDTLIRRALDIAKSIAQA